MYFEIWKVQAFQNLPNCIRVCVCTKLPFDKNFNEMFYPRNILITHTHTCLLFLLYSKKTVMSIY